MKKKNNKKKLNKAEITLKHPSYKPTKKELREVVRPEKEFGSAFEELGEDELERFNAHAEHLLRPVNIHWEK